MSKQTIAKVGNREITMNDVVRVKKYMPKEHQEMFNTPDGKREIINRMVIQEMVYQNALEENMDKEEAFLQEMEQIKSDKLKEYAIQKILNSVDVSEEEIKAFYEGNQEKFNTEEMFRASHILFEDKDLAEEVLTQIKDGKDFAEAAKEYSKCPSKDNGGDLGFFSKGRMVPEFENAVFELEIGDLGDIVQTQFGYHIIKLDEKKAPEKLSLEQVKEKISAYLLEQARNDAFSKVVGQLREKYEIDVNDDLVNEI